MAQVAGPLAAERVVLAAGGCEHSAAVTADGVLWTWGQTDGGRLGLSPELGAGSQKERGFTVASRGVESPGPDRRETRTTSRGRDGRAKRGDMTE